jgi:thiol-disulfide isomerase/thioredoxin
MKRITFLLFICLTCINSCKTTKPVSEGPAIEEKTADSQPAVNYSDQVTWLLGYFNQGQLRQEPHSVWFYKGYDEYRVSPESLKNLQAIDKEPLTIKIVMGTWCPDSRREVPRFMKVLDAWDFPYSKLTFIGVDNGKLSPVGEYEQLEIHRVPTFIIYINNIEAGRIIENPVTSLEQDMVKILGGMNNNK